MHFFRSLKIKHSIAFGIGAAVGVLYFMSAIAANADTVAGVTVAGNGKTVVRGAKVIKIAGSEVTAVSEWGAAKIQWRILVTGSTKFSPASSDRSIASVIQVGDLVGFSGQMDQKSQTPLIYASVLKNETIMQSASVLNGNVLEAAGNTLIVQTENGTSTIRVGTGTIMTRDGNRVRVKDLTAGETIKAFGTFNTRSRLLSAERIVSETLPLIPNTGAAVEKSSMFDHIVAWLSRGRSALTVR